jgi:hypothetical protein
MTTPRVARATEFMSLIRMILVDSEIVSVLPRQHGLARGCGCALLLGSNGRARYSKDSVDRLLSMDLNVCRTDQTCHEAVAAEFQMINATRSNEWRVEGSPVKSVDSHFDSFFSPIALMEPFCLQLSHNKRRVSRKYIERVRG